MEILIHSQQNPQGFCDCQWSSICEHTWKSSCILQVQDGGESSDGSSSVLYKGDESRVTCFNRSNSELVAGLLYQQHPAELLWACFHAYRSCSSYGMVLGFSAWLIKRFYLYLNCQVCIHLRWEVEACQSVGHPCFSSLPLLFALSSCSGSWCWNLDDATVWIMVCWYCGIHSLLIGSCWNHFSLPHPNFTF